MNLMYKPLGINMQFEENTVNVFCVENTEVFSDIVRSLYLQTSGSNGNFLLSDKEKELNISKSIQFVINPFEIDVNSKKIIGSLYKSLDAYAVSDMIKEKTEIYSYIQHFVEGLLSLSPFSLSYKEDIAVQDILKICDVKIDTADVSLAEMLCSYVKVMSEICGYHIFVFYNLKSFLSEDDLGDFYGFCFYQKVFPVILESHQSPILRFENTLIIDKDKCIITI